MKYHFTFTIYCAGPDKVLRHTWSCPSPESAQDYAIHWANWLTSLDGSLVTFKVRKARS